MPSFQHIKRENRESAMRNLVMQEHAPQEKLAGLICECGGRLILDFFAGEELCSKCGRVVKDRIEVRDEKEEWDLRFNDGKHPLTRSFESNRPVILKAQTLMDTRDGHGKEIKTNLAFMRMKRVNMSAQRDKRSMVKMLSLSVISSMKKTFNFSNTVEDRARQIMQQVISKGVTRGRSATKLSKAAVFIAMSESKLMVGFKMFWENADIAGPDLRMYARIISENLNLDLPTSNPVDMVSRIVNHLVNMGEIPELNSRAVKLSAIEIVEKVRQDPLMGGVAPAGVASAAIYIATAQMNINVRQMHLLHASGISTVTIRKQVIKICKSLGIANTLPKPEGK